MVFPACTLGKPVILLARKRDIHGRYTALDLTNHDHGKKDEFLKSVIIHSELPLSNFEIS